MYTEEKFRKCSKYFYHVVYMSTRLGFHDVYSVTKIDFTLKYLYSEHCVNPLNIVDMKLSTKLKKKVVDGKRFLKLAACPAW